MTGKLNRERARDPPRGLPECFLRALPALVAGEDGRDAEVTTERLPNSLRTSSCRSDGWAFAKNCVVPAAPPPGLAKREVPSAGIGARTGQRVRADARAVRLDHQRVSGRSSVVGLAEDRSGTGTRPRATRLVAAAGLTRCALAHHSNPSLALTSTTVSPFMKERVVEARAS